MEGMSVVSNLGERRLLTTLKRPSVRFRKVPPFAEAVENGG